MLAAVLAALTLTQVPAPDLVFEDAVPDDADDFFDLPFTVPAGVVELELRQRALSPDDILDFSLEDPAGFRGEGGGRIDTAVLNAEAATRSYLPGPIEPGTWIVSVGKAKLVSDAPRYRVEVFFRDTTTLPPATDRAPYEEPGPVVSAARFFAGDFHVHSEDSNDARPPLDEIASFAQGRGLDFVVVTDHNTTAHIDRLVQAQARAATDTPGFLFVPGVEFTTYGGHATGFGATELVDWRVGHDDITLSGALDAFSAQGALFSINHPALDLGDLCIGCAWTHEAPAKGSVHGVEIETGGYRQAGFLFFDDALFFWEGLLDEGHHLAALGGSDDHEAGVSTGSPIGDPTTLVFASELSVAALRQGILDSRTVVKLQGPDDPMITLDTSPARGGAPLVGAARGDTVAHHDVVTVSATVTGAIGMQLWFVVDGQYTDVRDITADPQTLTVDVTPPGDGEVRVRAEVDEGDVPRTVTSYVWITRAAPPEPDACGCAATSGAPPWMTLLGALGALFCVRISRRGGALRAPSDGRCRFRPAPARDTRQTPGLRRWLPSAPRSRSRDS